MVSEHSHDVEILRELARRYAETAAKAVQEERRELWRRHNSLVRTRPLVYVRWLAAWHEAAESRLQCQDRFYQGHERFLRQMIITFATRRTTPTTAMMNTLPSKVYSHSRRSKGSSTGSSPSVKLTNIVSEVESMEEARTRAV